MVEAIDEGLKARLEDLNLRLRERYGRLGFPGREELRALIQQRAGRICSLPVWHGEAIKGWLGDRTIVGVDGSINLVGGEFPHYVAILRALAKGMRDGEKVLLSDVYCPLVKEDEGLVKPAGLSDVQWDEELRKQKLAGLELRSAIEAIARFRPRLLLMDGPLLRYKIEVPALMERFVRLVLEAGTLVAGVIENIGTRILGELLGGAADGLQQMYDKELLFGLLDYGEFLEIRQRHVGRGFRTCFLRCSRDPGCIGIDVLEQQASALPEVAGILFSLTPSGGRGIPIWMDIVDREVRLTDELLEGLVEAYLDADLRQKLLVAKRRHRIY